MAELLAADYYRREVGRIENLMSRPQRAARKIGKLSCLYTMTSSLRRSLYEFGREVISAGLQHRRLMFRGQFTLFALPLDRR
jgi:hypothetical protein